MTQVVANQGKYAGGVELVPVADPTAGGLDVALVLAPRTAFALAATSPF